MKLFSQICIDEKNFKCQNKGLEVLGDNIGIECDVSCNFTGGSPARFSTRSMQWDIPEADYFDDLECIYLGKDIIELLNKRTLEDFRETLINEEKKRYEDEKSEYLGK